MPHADPDVESPLDDDAPPHVDALTLRRPDVPVDLGELAALRGEAHEIVEARVQILETLRKASIRATHPEDWVLFKARAEDGGQIVGFLEDAGTDRVRALWGIRIFNITKAEKIVGNDPTDFMYVITGDGECAITHEIVEQMEGGRSSKDDFCKDKHGAALDMAVRKAARANLDGGITRELAGMKSVPVQELEAAWIGTSKTIDRCRKGRGFGTHDERLGGGGERRLRANCEEAPGDRRRHAARSGDRRHQRISVRHRQRLLSIGDVVDGTGHCNDGIEFAGRCNRQLAGRIARAHRLHSADLRLAAGQGRDLGQVPAHDGDVDLVE